MDGDTDIFDCGKHHLDADEHNLAFFVVTYTAITNTGGFVVYENPGDFVYVLHARRANTLTIGVNTINAATFPTALGGGAITLTKMP